MFSGEYPSIRDIFYRFVDKLWPMQIYATRLPVLKAGHIIHTGPDFDTGYLQVVTVRNNRKKVGYRN